MTETTTIYIPGIDYDDDDLIHTKTLFRRHSKGPVMFNGCSPSGWYIERETDTQSILRYTFTDQFVIPPLTTIELWSNTATPIPIVPETQEQQQQSFVCIKTRLPTWNNARQWSITRLYDNTGREKAIFSHQTLPSTDKEKQG
ncbi:unnamed protein product [Rotaria sordida]|uniref:Uncharacterized protein n=1 Tax=Rotaria sordida TaxID=392033 RepID=A0A815WT43_9BILA|nr:unnamed protein product [Rotaria sordida]CAF1551701.1 unnamed protein product [Rotaria sordida]